MTVDSTKVRTLRLGRTWSQDKLSEISSLSLHTIQRIECGHKTSMGSIKLLAAVFDSQVDELILDKDQKKITSVDAVFTALKEFSHFSGKATCFEIGWFIIFLV